MGIYVHIHGSIEASREQLSSILKVIDSSREIMGHYADSWIVSDKGGGYMAYVFFGCPVHHSVLESVRDTVRQIAEAICTKDGDLIDFPEGIFSVVHELVDEYPPVFWHFKNGVFSESQKIQA